MNERIAQQKEQIRKRLGPDMFDRLYKLLWVHKKQDSSYEVIAKDLKTVTGKNTELRQICFSLEQLVFVEDESS